MKRTFAPFVVHQLYLYHTLWLAFILVKRAKSTGQVLNDEDDHEDIDIFRDAIAKEHLLSGIDALMH